VLVVDDADTDSAKVLRERGLQIETTNILMRTIEDRDRIARTALTLAVPEFATAKMAEAS